MYHLDCRVVSHAFLLCGAQALCLVNMTSVRATQACITIQKHAKGHAVRCHVARQTAAATCIQRHWRCHQAAVGYKSLRSANLYLQAGVRCWAARRHHKRTRAAVITLQVSSLCSCLMIMLQLSSLYRYAKLCLEEQLISCSRCNVSPTPLLSQNFCTFWLLCPPQTS